jgi:hypothetical protein
MRVWAAVLLAWMTSAQQQARELEVRQAGSFNGRYRLEGAGLGAFYRSVATPGLLLYRVGDRWVLGDSRAGWATDRAVYMSGQGEGGPVTMGHCAGRCARWEYVDARSNPGALEAWRPQIRTTDPDHRPGPESGSWIRGDYRDGGKKSTASMSIGPKLDHVVTRFDPLMMIPLFILIC